MFHWSAEIKQTQSKHTTAALNTVKRWTLCSTVSGFFNLSTLAPAEVSALRTATLWWRRPCDLYLCQDAKVDQISL